MTQINLPFEVDEIIEVKSFEEGFRGAWFRCKILEIITQKGELIYKLKYVDYPGERVHRTEVLEKFEGETYLMVRPPYPPHYHESELLKIKGDQEPLVVIHDSWKVGDLVDWLADGCYWSGKVVEMRENGALQVELTPPPFGEGGSYEALSENLRPMLEWSPEDGWKLPSMDEQKRQGTKIVSRNNEETREGATTQQSKGDEGLQLNIMESDSIEAAVYDLEELIVRIEWLKGMSNPYGGEGSTSCWKYENYRPSSTRM